MKYDWRVCGDIRSISGEIQVSVEAMERYEASREAMRPEVLVKMKEETLILVWETSGIWERIETLVKAKEASGVLTEVRADQMQWSGLKSGRDMKH